MNINKFNEIESELKQDFSQKYSGIHKLLYYSSFFGNAMSILLAFFFLSKLLIDSVDFLNVYLIYGIALIILTGLELFKRSLFNKFSLEFVSSNFSILKKSVIVLGISSIMVILFSFYSSIRGASEFTSKETKITNTLEQDIKKYSDSLNIELSNKNLILSNEVTKLKDNISKKDDEQTIIESNEKISKSQKSRISDLKNEKSDLKNEISSIQSKIVENEKITKSNIDEYSKLLFDKTNNDKSKNKSNSFVFIIISVIIELIILIGIYFDKHYKWLSYQEFKKRISNDTSYQRWITYTQILEVIYQNNPQINEKIQSTKSILENCKINNILVTNMELINCIKLLTNLKIVKSSGNSRFITKDYESAHESLKQNFKIK